ncbi:hypothetical protein FIBSPDRAFT_207730 [Athelia psychrophila]|uniref:Uncharacterized protein n=1 Tax=Athelia psychrophila TaxID=1759441 RepID=A0A166WL95_9AGAM|nr:hypothetical protein FIBSPDRAFT_207730 [Fibularhizoctonia sp. CBS 109695]
MVAQKSTKLAKYTYAERVLGAISQVQKEHKKHVVHLATIRAQVRKAAEEKKDKLGPQWGRWVGKAVHKLEADGVLEIADTHGRHVTFTPEGKKAINYARRSIGGKDARSSSPVEDEVLRRLSHELAIRGLKRKNGYAGEGDEDVDVSTPSRSAQSKRARSTPSHRKSAEATTISKMTKAQLIAALQQAQSRVTPNDDEAEHSREELDGARDRLVELRNHRSSDEMDETGTNHQEDSEPMTRPMTPPSSPTPPMTNPAPIQMLAHSRPLFGGRTQSGSFISAISKRPTPAPSSPGGSDYDVFGADPGPGPQTEDGGDEEYMLVTPEPTPSRDSQAVVQLREEIEQLREEVETYKSAAKQVQTQSALDKDALIAQTTALDALRATHLAAVASHDAHVTTSGEKDELLILRDSELHEARGTVDFLQLAAVGAANEMASLQDELERTRVGASETHAALLEKQVQIEQLNSDLLRGQLAEQDLRATLFDKEAELGRRRDERTSREAESTALQSTVTRLEIELAAVNQLLQSRVSDLVNQNSALERRIGEAAVSFNEQIQARDDALSAERGVNNDTINGLRAELAEAAALTNRLTVEVDESRKALQLFEDDALATAGELHSALNRSSAKLAAHIASIASLENNLTKQKAAADEELRAAKATHDGLVERSRAADDDLGQAQATLNAEAARAAALENEVANLVGRAQQSEEVVAALVEARRADENVIEGLKSGFEKLRQVQLESLNEFSDKIASAHPFEVSGSRSLAGRGGGQMSQLRCDGREI